MQILHMHMGADGDRQTFFRVLCNWLPIGVDKRAVMLYDAFEGFPGQIQPTKGRVAVLEKRHDTQALGVVVETADRPHGLVERIFAGMSERGVAEIVRERNRFDKVLVEKKSASKGPGDLGDLEAMGEPGAVVIALVIDEDLCLMNKATEGG